MAMIAYKCPHITVVMVDINAARIAAWMSDVSPGYLQPLRVSLCIRYSKLPNASTPATSYALIFSTTERYTWIPLTTQVRC